MANESANCVPGSEVELHDGTVEQSGKCGFLARAKVDALGKGHQRTDIRDAARTGTRANLADLFRERAIPQSDCIAIYRESKPPVVRQPNAVDITYVPL